MLEYRSKAISSRLSMKVALMLLLSCAACINKKTVLESRPDSSTPAELEHRAETIFAKIPRTAQSAQQAYAMMERAARASKNDDPQRYVRLYRAAWFGIWLTHYGDTGEESRLAKEAIVLCNTAVQLAPDKIEGYYYRAIAIGLFAQQNKLYGRDAMSEFRKDAHKAIEIDPYYDFGGPHRILGALYLRAPGPPAGIGSNMKAYQHLLEAERIAPGHPETLLFLTETCEELGRLEEARAHLNRVTTQIPLFGDGTDQQNWREWQSRLEKSLEQAT